MSDHIHLVAEFEPHPGLTVEVTASGQVVRVCTEACTDSTVTELHPATAAHLGDVLTVMGGHPLGAALTAAATLLGGDR